ncbi:ubiquinol-cytochrome C chaperone family protein [Parasphingopyxis marina]|uniref:Ubiquinol-cytochrome C chaperone n=1 Tax=Parasphingopyxis marina TaxID=2761622 RepID=A0A842HUW2_9SPHN|nr:ubiquinol-cytochrome C chaperone family protein [Parasphingopyxis marina]MBC2776217.1 ubiquinol-cytochrome C chaperone [Parasphingopyxis marina]
MSFLTRLFGRDRPREALAPLYRAIVGHARDPRWYSEGGVPDTQDGRFDMIAAILSLVLIRIEAEGEAHASESALLTEVFIDDMDSQLRQLGIGDVIVGKHIGKMMGALGGRMAAYREGFAPGGDPSEALARNLYRGEAPGAAEQAFAAARLEGFAADLKTTAADAVLAGALPALA